MIGRRLQGSSTSASKPRRNWRLDSDDEAEVKATSANPPEQAASAVAGGSSPSRGPSPKRARREAPLRDGGSGDEDEDEEEHAGGSSKAKAFAWMDSDDDESEEKNGAVRSGSDAEDRPGGQKDSSAGLSADEVFAELAHLNTFAGFVRLTDDLLRHIASMTAAHFVDLCQAAARVKYFDGSLFEEAFRHLTTRIANQEFTLEQMAEVMESLIALNACDDNVVQKVLSVVTPKIPQMDKAQRLRWFDLGANLKPQAAKGFLNLLKLPKEQPPQDEEGGQVISASGKLACRHFVRGFCSMGKNCTFSHEAGLTAPPTKNPVVMTQLQEDMKFMAASQKNNPARPVCRHFARGFCQIGASCTFRHPVQVVPPAQAGMWPQPHQQQQLPPHMPMQPPQLRPVGAMPPHHAASASTSQGPPRNMTLRTVSKPCVHFAAGNCPWGAKCHFLHVVSAVQKT